MARIRRQTLLSLRQDELRQLLYRAALACTDASYVQENPLVFPSQRQRTLLFRMGADRGRVEAGFNSRQELQQFFDETREHLIQFKAAHRPGTGIAHGIIREVLRTWAPPGHKLQTLREQHYAVLLGPCNMTIWVLRQLLDVYGVSGACLQRIREQSRAERLLEHLRTLPNNSPTEVLGRRQAARIAASRNDPAVRARIAAALDRQTAAITELVEFLN
ncbi:hypothetical protein KFL_000320030 [Klebsormidium nitens]|uniref:Uncharacterized protein n=1 Tax=Klebsormidium nitens TaxID=105231 RepID=A0A1Y1HLK9_KLENI|nr:hypothetical protein KFL_000320030 [Klebsormidium nitens]|eukprot:GAQ79505.1 hypothetical protein KFL_000320030 [Klebsormidium nitens]